MANPEPDIARDGGPFTVREALAALDLHMARAARSGDYGLHADLNAIADLIESQEIEVNALRAAGGNWLRRMLKGGIESLGKLPT